MPNRDLAEVLERHQDDLMVIPGVLGVALGREATGFVIQLFVLPDADKDLVRQQAAEILIDVPTELVFMDPPEAQGGS